MELDLYRPSDFVQVRHTEKLDAHRHATCWKNALYIGKQDGNHIVIYTDGKKEVLHKDIQIRPAIYKD